MGYQTAALILAFGLLPATISAQQIRTWQPATTSPAPSDSAAMLQATPAAPRLGADARLQFDSSRISDKQKSAAMGGAFVGGVVFGVAGLLAGSAFDNILNDQGTWNFGTGAAIGAIGGTLLGAGLGALAGWGLATTSEPRKE